MSETPEPSIPASPATPPPAATSAPLTADWLYRVAAWVAIIAGLTFIALTILWLVFAFWS
jgi:hypothetical protein